MCQSKAGTHLRAQVIGEGDRERACCLSTALAAVHSYCLVDLLIVQGMVSRTDGAFHSSGMRITTTAAMQGKQH
jgi:hypothetical protein